MAKTEQAHEMVRMLGTESAGGWLYFMHYAHRQLHGIIDSRGKASAERIRESFIGRAGFSGWFEMIEAPISEGGLGWNISKWKQWQRAFRLVRSNPYLEQLDLTPSQINTLYNETKPEFPTDLAGYEAHQASKAARLAERQANSLKLSNERIHELAKAGREKDQAIATLRAEMENIKTALASAEAKAVDLTKSITELTSEKAVLTTKNQSHLAEIDSLKQEIEKLREKADKFALCQITKDSLQKRIDSYNNSSAWKKLITSEI